MPYTQTVFALDGAAASKKETNACFCVRGAPGWMDGNAETHADPFRETLTR